MGRAGVTLLSKALAYYPLMPGYDFRTWHQMCIEFLFLVLVLAQIFSPIFRFSSIYWIGEEPLFSCAAAKLHMIFARKTVKSQTNEAQQ